MPTTSNEPSVYTKLRDKAEAQLQSGTTSTKGNWSMGLDALRLLHRLSSDPDKAQDALKLLHELQVHQVELDLQHEEIAANEKVLEDELELYRLLYDKAPIALCLVDRVGTVIRSNLAAAELFGGDKLDLEGQRIDTFLKPQDRPLLLALLERVAESEASASLLTEISDTQGTRHLQFQVGHAVEREQLLLACYECASEDCGD